ncbi:ADP-ribosylation factor GTPase activating protein, ER-Golgi transport [Elasticomyces elasticus]|uniref:ADP-ribosylation factor GTPase activating protein, ER-Golgi transport n=1 Tax=Exophiala sideris TaxID=1016849 RepID=A0ABR0J2R2_9EURO|nr:ADP-ribosylation factor GTPase activating protein, ER-Golgi transport [Elasticomyces elasticus]KAK5024990.1 ADP-ribosylation factor GTPase activating protein, ER-Golgi transport [Exophiala sideris]KAK5031420.1 ADP-ribosylation factor GTPase activating protein, ER-Golgi transport [Exophiala sideris]KAK5055028.1 ADP-ribosylation factor GTPase activating protein, ER-Golgi transport [Exophiala sideris]KAK5179909.1 ADP-ribosylation factor GTPase activating protein, ER-Golgi transport [Eurotiomyce
MTATKAQSQKIFEKLKSKQANKINELGRYGTNTPRNGQELTRVVWQWGQLRTMKVGGNESATKFFQSNGGSAALASKDAKVKYTSNAANKYKEELKRRAARDAEEYPEEVVVTDEALATPGDGASTPAEPADDFFSSWDKPTIKRPSNPPSRSGTPPVVSRSGSPFLSAGANGSAARPKSPSPLAGAANDAENALPAPTAIRTTSSSAIRKGPSAPGAGAKRTNVLGAKKTQKLGAKKVVGEEIDFEAAEKAAKAEAERIEKLGYDPEAEKAQELAKNRSTSLSSTKDIPAPTATPNAGGYGSSTTHARNPSEVERLGMGMGRLGFGQTASSKSASSAPAPKKLGFGSVGASKAPAQDDSEQYARQKFGTQKGISSDEFFGRANFDPSAQAEAKGRLQGFEGATSISSNAYFGRPEDDMTGLESGEYGDIETAAKDFVRRLGLTAGDDLENLINVAGEGGRKLRGAVARYLNS